MNKEELLERYNLLKQKHDDTSLWECFNVLTELQDDFLFNNFIDEVKVDYLKKDPILFIGKQVHYYLYNERIEDALRVISYYKEAPFISLTVDDFLKDLEKEIFSINKVHVKKDYPLSKMEEDMYSTLEERITKVIKYLSETNIRNYLDFIKEALISEKLMYRYKILLQFVLIEQAIDEDIKVSKDDHSSFVFNPKNTTLPFEKKNYLELVKVIDEFNEDDQIKDYAKEILNMCEVRLFPQSLLDQGDIVLISEVLIFNAKTCLNENVTLDDFLEKSYSSKDKFLLVDKLIKDTIAE